MSNLIRKWECDICKAQFDDEKNAAACEMVHKKPVRIRGFGYGERDERDIRSRIYPSNVVIEFSEAHGDFANYVLEHIGYRGV